jgi:hypothetical protein
VAQKEKRNKRDFARLVPLIGVAHAGDGA